MQIKGTLSDRTAYNQFLVLVGLILVFGGLFTVIGNLLCKALYGVEVLSDAALMSEHPDQNTVRAFRLLQAMMSIGTFIIPPVVAAYLFSNDAWRYLQTDAGTTVRNYLLIIALLLVAMPVINWMVEVNATMKLPDSLHSIEEWMKSSENKAAKLTEAFISDTGVATLIANLLVMAVIPAIGEEFLFRGVIQKLFYKLTPNRHISILFTAILFSALHMQFYGFFPRLMLGMAFGYLLIWTGSLWAPVLAHFINNSGAVIFTWLSAKDAIGFDPDKLGTGPGETLFLTAGFVLTTVVLWAIWKKAVPLKASLES